MADAADTANNETGAEDGVNPEVLYDGKGGELKGGASTDDKTDDNKTDDKSDDKTDDKADDKSEDDKSGDDKPEDKSDDEADEKGGEDDKGEEDSEDDVVPDTYDLKIAEDSLLDKDDMERIATEAKEQGLTNEPNK